MKNMRIRIGGLAGVRRAIGSGFILATDSARKSSDLGMHGLVKIVDFAENPYTRASVKASLKFSRSTLRLSKKSFNIGKKILGKIRSPFNGKVSGKIKNVLDVITWTARKLKQIVNAIRSLVAKLALILGGFSLPIFMFIIILDKNFDPGGRYDRVFTNLEISDLRFDSFNRDAIKRIDSNLRIKRAYSSNVIDEAQAYLKNKPVIYCKILLMIL